MAQVIHQAPICFGHTRARWWLAGLRQTIHWLADCSLPGIYKLLRRLNLRYKRGRAGTHSPDPTYARKVRQLATLVTLVARHPTRWVLLYQDELTYYRRPTLAQGWARAGSNGPVARQGTGYNTHRRIAGCLNALTGQFTSWQRTKFDRATFGRYLRAVEAAYPAAERIFVVLDNWPVHHHAEVAQALVGSKIQLVFLPTYSPWLNPTEKVWRKLYQERLHHHEYASAWGDLVANVADWLGQYSGPSPDLLRYTGLLTTDLIC